MEDKNPNDTIKQKIVNGVKSAVKTATRVVINLAKPILKKVGIFAIILLVLALFVWSVEKDLFDTSSSSSSIFNKGGTSYTDSETGEQIELIKINEDGTMWVIPNKTIDYIREQIMETSDIIRLNLTDEIDSISDLETPENKEKLNKYIREFLKAEQATYYPNLEY